MRSSWCRCDYVCRYRTVADRARQERLADRLCRVDPQGGDGDQRPGSGPPVGTGVLVWATDARASITSAAATEEAIRDEHRDGRSSHRLARRLDAFECGPARGPTPPRTGMPGRDRGGRGHASRQSPARARALSRRLRARPLPPRSGSRQGHPRRRPGLRDRGPPSARSAPARGGCRGLLAPVLAHRPACRAEVGRHHGL